MGDENKQSKSQTLLECNLKTRLKNHFHEKIVQEKMCVRKGENLISPSYSDFMRVTTSNTKRGKRVADRLSSQ